MFKELLNNINNKYNTIKEENNHYKELLNSTTTLTNLLPLPQETKEISEHLITYITTNSPDINKEKARIIANLIPINETFLEIFYTKEIITNKEYFIITTNDKLWIINTTNYTTIPYNNIEISIIKNNLMSKTILFNNILLEINGSNDKINNLISIITNETTRQNITREKRKYLCNITPIYQKINANYSGISIDNQNNIVFHSKENNYLLNINNISNYEILLDNQSYLSKTTKVKNAITNFQNSCYQITLRITTKDNQTIIIPILEPNSFGNKYQGHDTIFQTNLNFAISITNKLDELFPPQY